MEDDSLIVKVPCIITNEDELIPCWDERVKYVLDDGETTWFGDYEFNGSFVRRVTGYMNVNTKEVFKGSLIRVEEPPNNNGLLPGTEVVVELKSFGPVTIDRIVKIFYNDEHYECSISKGSDIRDYRHVPTDIDIKDGEYYEVRTYKPLWLLESGNKVTWSHSMKILNRE